MRTCLATLTGVWAEDNIEGAPAYDEMPGMVAYEGIFFAPSLGNAGAVSGRLPNGESVFLFSFLAVGGDQATCDAQDNCDHRAGGINEMRKQFENWLIKQNEKVPGYDKNKKDTWFYKSNPCLEAISPFPLSYGKDVFASNLKGGLRPAECLHMKNNTKCKGWTISQCYDTIDEFFAEDKSLRAWRRGGCEKLAAPVQTWGFMASFTRAVHHQKLTKKQEYESMEKDQCTEENANKTYACGRTLTNALLFRFLRKIGWE